MKDLIQDTLMTLSARIPENFIEKAVAAFVVLVVIFFAKKLYLLSRNEIFAYFIIGGAFITLLIFIMA